METGHYISKTGFGEFPIQLPCWEIRLDAIECEEEDEGGGCLWSDFGARGTLGDFLGMCGEFLGIL